MMPSEEQRAVIESKDDHILVLAGAGCGKTTTLVSFVKENIGTKGDPKTIVLTFSNKAAEDVKEKLSNEILDYGTRMFVGTIHEFCHDMIVNYGANIGLDPNMRILDSERDRLRVFAEAVYRTPSILEKIQGFEKKEIDQWMRNSLHQMSIWKRSFGTVEPQFKTVYDEYDQALESMGVMDFDDILVRAYRILTERQDIANMYASHYGLICIDEAQDLDMAQYSVIKMLANGTMRTFMVGDPNQSIYGFSGASPRYMCEHYVRDFEVRKYRLKDNYRSSRAVLNAAKKIEPRFEPVGHVPLEGEFSIEQYSDPVQEAEGVVSSIKKLLVDGHKDIQGMVMPESICVMARNGYLLEFVANKLESEGIEYTLRVGGTGPEFISDLFLAMWNGLKVLLNPRDALHLEEVNSVLGRAKETPIDVRAMKTGSGLERCLADVWSIMLRNESNGIFDMRSVEGHLEEYIGSVCDDYELNRDLEEWRSVLERYVRGTTRGRRSISGLLGASSLRKVNPTAPRGVVLSTVHMSKGLEYDVVFVITVNKDVFPDKRARTEEQLDEERHDMFVAITRAKRICHVSWISSRTSYGKTYAEEPSVFIEELSS